MTSQKISIFEHQACEISLKIPNENIGDWLCYGSAIRKGYQECIHFNVEPDKEKNNFKITIPSIDVKSAALKFELYEYQIFLKNINSHQEFLVISGEIEAKKRTCIHDAEGAISDTSIELESIISDTSINIEVNIAGGLSAYQIAKLHGYGGSENEWIAELEGAAAAANSAKKSENDAQLSLAASLEAQDKCQEEARKSENFKNEALGYSQSAALSANNAQTFAETSQAAASAANSSKIAAENYENNAQESMESAITSQLAAEQAALDARIAQSITEDAAGVAQGFAQRAAGAADDAVLAAAEAKAAESGAAGAADVVRYDFLPMTLEWLDSRFTKNLGEGNFSMTYTDAENTLRVAFALETTAAQIEESRALLDRVLPRNLVTEISDVPMDFRRLEYIENPSNAFIFLDKSLGWDYEIEAEYFVTRVPEPPATGFGVLIGHVSEPRQCVFTNVNHNTVRYDYNKDIDSRYIEGWVSDCRFHVKVDKNVAVFNNLTTNKTFTLTCQAGEFEQPAKVGVFASGKGAHYPAWIKLYSLKGWRAGVPQFNFLPALDPAGVPCLFDKVNRKAYRNVGSGHFVAGAETQKQLDAVLRGLPDRTGQDGGELHLRLSDELYESAVASGIIEETATAKNWQIAYDPTTETAA